ncbi:MAG TPA: trigger factor [Eggerthellaceae bacterium]|nr:trigger factor [Eggerthellaceae bacterium]
MKVDVVSKNDEEVRLRATADADEMERAFNDGLDAFILQYNLGSLKGDTSYEKICNALDEEEAKQAVYSSVVNFLVPFAISEYGEAPLATYGIESDDTPEPDKSFSFEMTFLVKPHFKLSSYEPATVTIEKKPEVLDSDIEEQIRILVRHIIAVNENKNPDSPDLEIPEITDEWVAHNLADMNISTVDDLRDRFRKTSEEELATRYEQAKMAAAMEAYVPRFEGEVSEKMLSAMTQELFETFVSDLLIEGTNFEEFSKEQNITEEQARASLSAQAENQLVQGFILDAIYDHEQIKLQPSDLLQALKNMAPGKEEDTFDAMQKSGRGFLLKQAAQRMKAAEWILDNTKFVVE